MVGKDFGWFQSSEPVEEDMLLDPDEVPRNLHFLIPLAKKWGIGDDVERSEFMDSATLQEVEELEEKVGPKMQEISEWILKYPEDHYSDTTYFFTYLMCAYDEADSYNAKK